MCRRSWSGNFGPERVAFLLLVLTHFTVHLSSFANSLVVAAHDHIRDAVRSCVLQNLSQPARALPTRCEPLGGEAGEPG